MKHPTTYQDTPIYPATVYPVPMADEAAGFTVLDMLGLLVQLGIPGNLQIQFASAGDYDNCDFAKFSIGHGCIVFSS